MSNGTHQPEGTFSEQSDQRNQTNTKKKTKQHTKQVIRLYREETETVTVVSHSAYRRRQYKTIGNLI